jgi:hypothetical protein
MKIENFREQLQALLPDKFGDEGSVPPNVQNEWIEEIKDSLDDLKDKNWDEISESLAHFNVDGIGDDVIIASASILATSNDSEMCTDIGSSTCFMNYSAKKNARK